jgi:UDP-2,4-diacetamido-2,4,6-trideoxy-beta-L-altropyranose hydrolase
MSSRALLFRCDANPSIGIGHVMRCLALAQAWRAVGGHSVFAAAELPSGLTTHLRGDGFDLVHLQQSRGTIEDANATSQAARSASADWVVIDGDAFGTDFIHVVRDSNKRVLLIDDFAKRESFPADLIWNPNIGASEEDYRRKNFHARLLLGSPYIPLRREFTSLKLERRFPDQAKRILVTLGGSDPENLAPRIVGALRDVDALRLTVVAGPGYEHWDALQPLSAPAIRLLQNRSDMPALMHDADLAITAAGGTLWELLYCRCAVLSYSRNPVQARVVDQVAKRGAAVDLGDTRHFDSSTLAAAVERLAADRPLRQRMADTARLHIDGKGPDRVAAAIQAAE